MMLLRLLLAFFAFTLDVTVKAESLVALQNDFGSIQMPGDCRKNVPCTALVENSRKLNLKLDHHGSFILSPKAIGGKKSNNTFLLISGSGLLRAEKEVRLNTLHFEIEAQDGYAFIEQQGEQFSVTNMSAQLKLRPRLGRAIELFVGQTVVVGPVKFSGSNDIEWPKAAEYTSLIKATAPLFDGTREEFRTLAETLRVSIEGQVFAMSHLYLEMADRRVAEYLSEQKRRAQAQARLQKQEAEARRLFRERNSIQ